MTKVEITDYIDAMTGYKFHPKVIEYTINQAYGQMVHDYVNGVIDSFQFWTKEYTGQDVSEDTTKDMYYTTLPAAIVSIGNPTGGVREINTNQGYGFNFFPMNEDEREYFDGLDSDSINTDVGYEVIGNRVYYYNISESITKVRMVLNVQFSEFASTDEVIMPAGRDYDIVALTIEMLQKSNNKIING